MEAGLNKEAFRPRHKLGVQWMMHHLVETRLFNRNMYYKKRDNHDRSS